MVVIVGGEKGDGGENMKELREIMKATWEIRWKGVVLGQLETRRVGEGDTSSGNSGDSASFSSSNYAEVEGEGDGGNNIELERGAM